jgi:hypothetical protein
MSRPRLTIHEITHISLVHRYMWSWDGYHLRVERRDGRDGIPWDDLQAIKNHVCGPDVLLVEFYPEEHAVVNDINARHLWSIGGELRGFGNYYLNGRPQPLDR